MRKLWEEQGAVWVKPSRKFGSGRKPKIKKEQEEELGKYIQANPDALIRDMKKFLVEKCDLYVNDSTVWRSVHKNGWLRDRPPRLKNKQGHWLPSSQHEGQAANRKETEKKPGRVKKASGEKKIRASATDKLLVRTRAWVKLYMSDPKFDGSHDYGHVDRVANLAMHILRSEQALHPDVLYDPQLLEISALLHDIEDHKYKDMPPRPQNPPPLQTWAPSLMTLRELLHMPLPSRARKHRST